MTDQLTSKELSLLPLRVMAAKERGEISADLARDILEGLAHETSDGHTREVRTSNDRPVPPLYGGKVRLACGCIDICTNQRDHLGWSKPPSEKALDVSTVTAAKPRPCPHGLVWLVGDQQCRCVGTTQSEKA